jgi:hypothetical protein
MPTEEQMIVNERRKYLKLMKSRYQKASRRTSTHMWVTHVEGIR